MNAKEFEIKKFETNYPELVTLIDVWAEHSIKQNWDAMSVLLNQHTVPDCPEDKYSHELQGNERGFFFHNLGEKVGDYLLAKGYKMISRMDDQLLAPDGKFMYGKVVKGYTKIIKK